jgi:hypothetical protein
VYVLFRHLKGGAHTDPISLRFQKKKKEEEEEEEED